LISNLHPVETKWIGWMSYRWATWDEAFRGPIKCSSNGREVKNDHIIAKRYMPINAPIARCIETIKASQSR